MDTRPWGGRAANEALRRIKTNGRAHNHPCCICNGPINYDLAYPDPMSCSVQHVKSRNTHPELTWVTTNHQPAHLVCNQSAGDGTSSPYDLGITSLN